MRAYVILYMIIMRIPRFDGKPTTDCGKIRVGSRVRDEMGREGTVVQIYGGRRLDDSEPPCLVLWDDGRGGWEQRRWVILIL